MAFYKASKPHSSFLGKKEFVPGTYQIKITRMEMNGRQKSLTAYVPIDKEGKNELQRRHFEGLPHRKPEYFVK